MEVHKLSMNMHVMGVEGADRNEQSRKAGYLLSIGDGHEPTFVLRGLDLISLPECMCLRTRDVSELISFTFLDIARRYMDVDFLRSRGILTPLNENVDEINSKVVEQLPGDACTFYSADSMVECDDSDVYPVEFLNSLQPSGCPPHRLVLKVGMIVMLWWSIVSHKGLCNGTRLIIRRLGRQVLDAEIVIGRNIGSRILIPRIPLVSSASDLPFELQRVQFSIRAAFAMTINKAHGQTMETIGLYLPRPVFSHGQLYVALSRVRNAGSVGVLIIDTDG
ncbi:hypothetical protein O6H91_02G092100 [Diphasiastrum complanatum]|uniref:Uncharacterized protein n=1 Tax=Diphasiastrum complanatum TaxID=34168 RepID=A0ACC2EI50_DIPCM|nr:hypothetical protein O6H91_02G092100 [Diphasiastrum complanatum]